MTRKRYFLLGGILTAVTLAALLILGNRPVVRAAEGDQVEYTFGRPVEKGEQTYTISIRVPARPPATRPTSSTTL
jgi:hypothetical protein